MRIITAARAGFCFGVERAVSMARRALAESRGPVFSLGPIIHNPQVVKELADAGLVVVDTLDQVDSGTVVIRSHGAAASVYQEAARKNLTVLDATCPFVKKMHGLARGLAREGYTVVLLGEANHPEIKSLLDDPGFSPLVVTSREELLQRRLGKRVGLISQTTQSQELFREVAGTLLTVAREMKIHNTICDSTQQRQDESLAIARQVEAMLVIGGRNSANTRRLYELCQMAGTPTHHLEVPEELQPGWLQGKGTVGITAGASTPKRLIVEAVEKIKTLYPDLQCDTIKL